MTANNQNTNVNNNTNVNSNTKDPHKEAMNQIAKKITRKGAAEMFKWIGKTDFFTAPYDIDRYGKPIGSLADYTIKYYKKIRMLYADYLRGFGIKLQEKPELEEQVAFLAVAHSLERCNLFEKRHSKSGSEYFVRNDSIPLGKGVKSLYLAMSFVDVTPEEALALRYAYDDLNLVSDGEYQAAKQNNPLVRIAIAAAVLPSLNEG